MWQNDIAYQEANSFTIHDVIRVKLKKKHVSIQIVGKEGQRLSTDYYDKRSSKYRKLPFKILWVVFFTQYAWENETFSHSIVSLWGENMNILFVFKEKLENWTDPIDRKVWIGSALLTTVVRCTRQNKKRKLGQDKKIDKRGKMHR